MADLMTPSGVEWPNLTTQTKLEPSGAAKISLSPVPHGRHQPYLWLSSSDVASVLAGLQATPPPTSTKLWGLDGLGTYLESYTNTTAAQVAAAKKELGVGWDRWDWSYEPVPVLEKAVEQGFECVLLFKPKVGENQAVMAVRRELTRAPLLFRGRPRWRDLRTVALSTIEAELVEAIALAKRLGIKFFELLNEPYYENVTAAAYAKLLSKALELTAGTDIVILQKYWGDYAVPGTSPTEWSQAEAGRGWYVDTTNALKELGHSPITDVAVHPYGPLEATGIWGGGNPSGWGSFAKARELTPGLTYFVTEVGQEATAGNTAEEAAQAKAMHDYVQTTATESDIEMLLIYTAMEEGGEAYGVYKEGANRTLGEPKLGAKALAEAIHAI